MAISRHQKMLVHFLLKHGLRDKDRILGISLLLKDSEWAMEELILFMEDNNPTEAQIMEKAIELHLQIQKKE